MRTSGDGKPWLVWRCSRWGAGSASSAGFKRPKAASGEVSVMPQPWITAKPKRAMPSINEAGTADPPTTVRMGGNDQRSGSRRRASSRPSQMVGTPAVRVTPSPANRSSRLSGSRWGPGKTWLAPTKVAAKGNPQALAWNMGTTGVTVSWQDSPTPSGRALARACSTVERWEYTTPLGRPVVPEV